MAWIDDEISLTGSNPIELHLFVAGSQRFAQASNSRSDIVYLADTYVPMTIRRSKRRITTNDLKNSLTLSTSLVNPFVVPYTVAPLEAEVFYYLYRGQNGTFVQFWHGIVQSVKKKGRLAEIIVSPYSTRMRRNGLSRRFCRLCPYPLYSTHCGENPTTWKVSGVVDSVSGLSVTSTTFATKADGYFKGGWLDCNNYTRMIMSHTTDTIVLSSPIPGIGATMAFDAYRGCNHTLTECDTIFGRKLSYGGQPYLPDKNPFTGDAIA